MSEHDVYPQSEVEVIALEFCSHLHLTRSIQAVRTRRGKDAKYVISKPYKAKVEVRANGKTYWHKICVPKGYMTDMASVPRIFRSIVSRIGPHLEACIIHDWLYDAWIVRGLAPEIRMKRFADDALKVGMREARVNRLTTWIVWRAATLAGGKMFRKGPNASPPPESDVLASRDQYESCCGTAEDEGCGDDYTQT